MKIDDDLDWLRQIRAEIAEKCDYSSKKMGDYYRSLQAQYFEHIIKSDATHTPFTDKAMIKPK